MIALLGSAAVIAGAFLPWATASISAPTGFEALNETFSKNGIDGDGVITLVVAIVALILAGLMLAVRNKVPAIIEVLAALAIGAVALVDISDINSKLGTLNVGDATLGIKTSASVGIGLWITAAGAALLLIGAIVGLFTKTR